MCGVHGANALLIRALHTLRDLGMTEAMHFVNTQNQTSALGCMCA
jgi:hypothetical protein